MRFGASIDVVAEEDVNRTSRAERREIAIYDSKHLLKEIGAAVNIAYGVDAKPAR